MTAVPLSFITCYITYETVSLPGAHSHTSAYPGFQPRPELSAPPLHVTIPIHSYCVFYQQCAKVSSISFYI